MDKKFLTLFSFIIITLLQSEVGGTHVKIHNNYVFFSGKAKSVSFKVADHCITKKQPFDNKEELSVGGTKLNIRAGRHQSRSTMLCVGNMLNIDKNTIMFPYFTSKRDPQTFNFAVKGTLTINNKRFKNIILAQNHGNVGNVGNAWWFGGSNCRHKFHTDKNEVNCTADDGTTWCFIHGIFADFVKFKTKSNQIIVKTKRCSA